MLIQKIESQEELVRLQRLMQSSDIRPFVTQSTCEQRLNMYAIDIYIVLDDDGVDVGYYIVQPVTEVTCEMHVGFLEEARRSVSREAGSAILGILARQYKTVIAMIASKNKRAIHYANLHNFKLCGIINDAVELITGKDDLVIMQRQLS